MSQESEIRITEAILDAKGYDFEKTDESSRFTGEFDDVQWEEHGVLLWSPKRSAPGALFHELGHLLGGTPEEIASTNWSPDGMRHTECEDRAVETQAVLYYLFRRYFDWEWVADALGYVGLDGISKFRSFEDLIAGSWASTDHAAKQFKSLGDHLPYLLGDRFDIVTTHLQG